MDEKLKEKVQLVLGELLWQWAVDRVAIEQLTALVTAKLQPTDATEPPQWKH